MTILTTTAAASSSSSVPIATDTAQRPGSGTMESSLDTLMLKVMETCRKMRNLNQQLNVAQRQNSYQLAAGALEKKRESIDANFKAGMISSGLGGGLTLLGGAFVGGKALAGRFTQPAGNGLISEKMAGKLSQQWQKLGYKQEICPPGVMSQTDKKLILGELDQIETGALQRVESSLLWGKTAAERKIITAEYQQKMADVKQMRSLCDRILPDAKRPEGMDVGTLVMQGANTLGPAAGQMVSQSFSQTAASAQVAGDYIKDNQGIYERERVMSEDRAKDFSQQALSAQRSLNDLYNGMTNALMMR
ncbi:hypothetical protein [Serratia quinivorans]|uniref:hypothetical protein n=1 Tax=Serratia quinivorans TaxID=137545 RepID=UPI002179E132|nr:hypothetical protein [Serratia quinivorans]CAI1010442.1 Secretion system effector D [Serratia quinivorans]CAI1810819.1 Secretion system effector D [Serratia quinivorans]